MLYLIERFESLTNPGKIYPSPSGATKRRFNNGGSSKHTGAAQAKGEPKFSRLRLAIAAGDRDYGHVRPRRGASRQFGRFTDRMIYGVYP